MGSPSTGSGAPTTGRILRGNSWVDSIAPDTCMYCGQEDWQPGFGPRTIVCCSCCSVRCFHVDCLSKEKGEEVDESILAPEAVITCSKECDVVHAKWTSKTGARVPLKGEPSYTIEAVKYKDDDKAITATVDTAIKIFRSSFKKLLMGNGRDLVEMVCQSYETPDDEVQRINAKDEAKRASKGDDVDSEEESDDDEEEDDIFNFGDFRLVALRKNGTIVTVATLRLFGPFFAEMPFISTREGYRREGNCRRLVRAVEGLLLGLGVKYLVLPALKAVLPMWTNKFGFELLTEHEHQQLQKCSIVDMDPSTANLVKKKIGAPVPPPATSGSRALSRNKGAKAAAPASKSHKASPALPKGVGNKKVGKSWGQRLGQPSKKGRNAASKTAGDDGSSDSSSSSSSSEEEDDESSDSDGSAAVEEEEESDAGSEEEEEEVLHVDGRTRKVKATPTTQSQPASLRTSAPARPASPTTAPSSSQPAQPGTSSEAPGAASTADTQPPGASTAASTRSKAPPKPRARAPPAPRDPNKPKRNVITMEMKRKMDAERLGIPYEPGKPLIYPVNMPPMPPLPPIPVLPPMPKRQPPQGAPRGRGGQKGRTGGANQAWAKPMYPGLIALGLNKQAGKINKKRRRAERAAKLRVKLAGMARAAVRSDAVLALTLAEAVAQSLLEKGSVEAAQAQLRRAEAEALLMAAHIRHLHTLLHRHNIAPPALPNITNPTILLALPAAQPMAAPSFDPSCLLRAPGQPVSQDLPLVAPDAAETAARKFNDAHIFATRPGSAQLGQDQTPTPPKRTLLQPSSPGAEDTADQEAGLLCSMEIDDEPSRQQHGRQASMDLMGPAPPSPVITVLREEESGADAQLSILPLSPPLTAAAHGLPDVILGAAGSTAANTNKIPQDACTPEVPAVLQPSPAVGTSQTSSKVTPEERKQSGSAACKRVLDLSNPEDDPFTGSEPTAEFSADLTVGKVDRSAPTVLDLSQEPSPFDALLQTTLTTPPQSAQPGSSASDLHTSQPAASEAQLAAQLSASPAKVKADAMAAPVSASIPGSPIPTSIAAYPNPSSPTATSPPAKAQDTFDAADSATATPTFGRSPAPSPPLELATERGRKRSLDAAETTEALLDGVSPKRARSDELQTEQATAACTTTSVFWEIGLTCSAPSSPGVVPNSQATAGVFTPRQQAIPSDNTGCADPAPAAAEPGALFPSAANVCDAADTPMEDRRQPFAADVVANSFASVPHASTMPSGVSTASVPGPPTPSMQPQAQEASPDFASPNTMAAFDQRCLGRLLPRVLHDFLAPSPSPPKAASGGVASQCTLEPADAVHSGARQQLLASSPSPVRITAATNTAAGGLTAASCGGTPSATSAPLCTPSPAAAPALSPSTRPAHQPKSRPPVHSRTRQPLLLPGQLQFNLKPNRAGPKQQEAAPVIGAIFGADLNSWYGAERPNQATAGNSLFDLDLSPHLSPESSPEGPPCGGDEADRDYTTVPRAWGKLSSANSMMTADLMDGSGDDDADTGDGDLLEGAAGKHHHARRAAHNRRQGAATHQRPSSSRGHQPPPQLHLRKPGPPRPGLFDDHFIADATGSGNSGAVSTGSGMLTSPISNSMSHSLVSAAPRRLFPKGLFKPHLTSPAPPPPEAQPATAAAAQASADQGTMAAASSLFGMWQQLCEGSTDPGGHNQETSVRDHRQSSRGQSRGLTSDSSNSTLGSPHTGLPYLLPPHSALLAADTPAPKTRWTSASAHHSPPSHRSLPVSGSDLTLSLKPAANTVVRSSSNGSSSLAVGGGAAVVGEGPIDSPAPNNAYSSRSCTVPVLFEPEAALTAANGSGSPTPTSQPGAASEAALGQVSEATQPCQFPLKGDPERASSTQAAPGPQPQQLWGAVGGDGGSCDGCAMQASHSQRYSTGSSGGGASQPQSQRSGEPEAGCGKSLRAEEKEMCVTHALREKFEAMGEEMMSGSSGGSSSGGYEGDEGEVRLALQTAALFSWPADV